MLCSEAQESLEDASTGDAPASDATLPDKPESEQPAQVQLTETVHAGLQALEERKASIEKKVGGAVSQMKGA